MALSFGVYLPAFGELAEPTRLVELARIAEGTGFDGFFIWDELVSEPGMAVADPFVALAGVAAATTRLRLGALVTPLARRRPWVFARQTATLDRLSGGRLTVGIGLGDDESGDFSAFSGEVVEQKLRAERLDESLELCRQLWSRSEVDFDGEHLSAHVPAFLPGPLQDPLPVWAACLWPHRRPLERAARCEGCFPLFEEGGGPPLLPRPEDLATVRRELLARGARPDIDLVCRGATGLIAAGELGPGLAALEEVGMTWWLDSYAPGESFAEVADCLRKGPPAAG
ncbi:MAG TPA: LLM class flavin-dependent oxidoreductase [Acidimicrobiales bacterium]|nr:LLM class flavin-dependent oxidoreductase [Acidimicrobiales bacterium]